MTIGLAIAEDQDAAGNKREGKQRSDIREISESRYIEKTSGNSHNKSSHPGGEVWRLVAPMDAAKNPGEKAVPGHGEPHARLANLEHQQRGDHSHERADQNYQPYAGDMEFFERIDDGRGIIDEGIPSDEAGEDHDNRDIEQCTDD